MRFSRDTRQSLQFRTMSRRTYQRRNMRRAATSCPRVARSNQETDNLTFEARGESWLADQECLDGDSGFSCSSDSETEDNRQVIRRTVPTVNVQTVYTVDIPSDNSECLESELDFDSDSDADSGYASVEDPDERADFYDDLLERFRAEGPTLANHGDNTKKMIQEQEQKWRMFCKHRKLEPIEALCQCDVPLFKVYLVWRVKNSRIKKESTVMTYWKVLSMVYSQKTASWMKEEVLYDVRSVGFSIAIC